MTVPGVVLIRLSHGQIRQAVDGRAGQKRDLRCPLCLKDHLELFGDDDVKCWADRGCTTAEIIIWCKKKLGLDGTPKAPKAPEGPPAGRLELAEYGLAKNLSAQVLTEYFGLTEGPHPYYKDVFGICMPYWDEDGKEVTCQWRWGMGSKNRRYLANRSSYIYGGRFLRLLEDMAKAGKGRDDLFFVEGESNTHTMTQAGFPTLGLPGVGNWQHKWAELKCLQAAKRILFFLDMKEDGTPESAAILGARKVAESFPPGKVLAVKLPCKDISKLWLNHTTEWYGDGVEGFRRDLQDAVMAARPIIPIREELEGKPVDLGEQVLAACPILREFVELTLPHVETDINNIICDFLAAAGAVIGLNGYSKHLYDTHPPGTFHLLIANTSVGKGTVWGCVDELFRRAVADWKKCLRTSARSHTALLRALKEVSDRVIMVPNEVTHVMEPKPNLDYTGGRLLLRCSEISSVFKSMRAEWSMMSQVQREAFDGRPLSNDVGEKQKSIRVDEPYALAILGDVAPWELSEVIADVDFANGVANRFVWCAAHRTKTLPHVTSRPDYRELAARLRRVIPSEPLGEIKFSEAGLAAWDTWVYTLPSEDEGRLGAACGRMRANGLRLAVLFAVLDESRLGEPDTFMAAAPTCTIQPRHVQAAAAIMNRHRETVAWFLARPAKMPESLPEAGKDKLWHKVEKVRSNLKNGRITGSELYKLFSNETAEERKKIAEAAGVHANEEIDAKGNKFTVWG